MVELADSLDSGSSAHSGRAGSSPASRTTHSGLKSKDLGSVFCFLGTFSAYSFLWIPSLNSGKWAVSNTFLTGALEETGCHFLGKQLLPLHIQVPINVCGHLNISVAHVLLHILQGAAAVEKQACAAMPEFVEANMGHMLVSQKVGEVGGHIVRGEGLAVGPLENIIILLIICPAELPVTLLLGFGAEKNFSGFLGQREGAAA